MAVAKTDHVTVYVPVILEAASDLPAYAGIGAIHSVLLGGFSADALVATLYVA